MTDLEKAMKRMKSCLEVPTGHIIISKGEKNKDLEFLSLGDYGSSHNVKASFLGLDKDIEGVPNSDIMPLEEKWVITISTQYGCSMNCTFCDVPKVGPGINVTYDDLINQIKDALSLHPEVKYTKRLNIHFARMGEPTWNGNVIDAALCLKRSIYEFWEGCYTVHPVVSTMLPKNNRYLKRFLQMWCRDIKNNCYKGEAGLQFSINSTSNIQRNEMFSGNSLSLEEISFIGYNLPFPIGRKYALNFALADDYKVDAQRLRKLFDPRKFMVKITPLHKTDSCVNNKIKTSLGYTEFTPYKKIEQELKDVGFDVLVFIPSLDEDLGRITCGNAILSGSKPDIPFRECFVKTSRSIFDGTGMNL